jgi:hypothetical protein
MRRATSLKLEIYRCSEDGFLHGEVVIKCGFGMFDGKEESAIPGDDERKQAEALRFVRRLLGDFERKRPDDRQAAG